MKNIIGNFRIKFFQKPVVVFFLLSLIAFRKFLLAPGLLGHNWDWSIPLLPEYLRQFFKSMTFVWWDFSLGQQAAFNPSLIPFSSLITTWGYLNISGEIVSKILPFLTTFIACLNMFLLTKTLLKDKTTSIKEERLIIFPAFLSGLFYGFSPFLFQDIIGGASSFFLTYALFPLVLLTFYQKRFFSTIILLTLMTIALQNFILVIFLLLTQIIFTEKKEIRMFLGILISVFFTSLYWILPVSYFFFGAISSLEKGESLLWLETIKNAVPSLREIFVATGYFRPLFTMSIHPWFEPVWWINSYLFVILVVFFANIVLAKKKAPWFWIFFLLFSFIPSTGAKNPFGSLILWLYQHFPPMIFFRSPQHFLILPTIAFAILIGTGSFFLLSSFSPQKKFFRLAVFLLLGGLLFWLHPFFVYGDLGREQLKQRFGAGNYLDNFQLAPDDKEIFRLLSNEKGDFRILVLPMTASPYYLETQYQSEAQGGDPQIFRSPNPMIVSDFMVNINSSHVLRSAEKEIYQGENQQSLMNFLKLTNTKYIIFRKDVILDLGSEVQTWDYEKMKDFLDQNSFLNKIKDGQYIILYKLNDQILSQHFYLPQHNIQLTGKVDDFIGVTSFEDLTIVPNAYFSNLGDTIQPEVIVSPFQVLENFLKTNLLYPEEVCYPYVRIKPGTLFYSFILIKEEWQQRREKDLEKLFGLKLFYASKRINEIQKWSSSLEDKELKEVAGNYHQLMSEALSVLEQIKTQTQTKKNETNWGYLVSKFERYLEDNDLKIQEVYFKEYQKQQKATIEAIAFNRLREWLEELKVTQSKDQIGYEFDTLQEGTYQLLLEKENYKPYFKGELIEQKRVKIDGVEVTGTITSFSENWYNLGQYFFSKGKHRFDLVLPPGRNLIESNTWEEYEDTHLLKIENSQHTFADLPKNIFPDTGQILVNQISDYTGNGLYQISFDYKANKGQAGLVLVEKVKEKVSGEKHSVGVNIRLPKIKSTESLSHFNTVIQANPRAISAKIYLLAIPETREFSDISFKSVQIERIFLPKIVARLENPLFSTEKVSPQIDMLKINPVKYRLVISGARTPYTLVFNESFDSGWKVYLNGQDTPLSEKKHLLANGYANSWFIAPEDVGGKENYELTVEFWPQKLFYLGAAISGISFLGLLFYFLWKSLRKKSF